VTKEDQESWKRAVEEWSHELVLGGSLGIDPTEDIDPEDDDRTSQWCNIGSTHGAEEFDPELAKRIKAVDDAFLALGDYCRRRLER